MIKVLVADDEEMILIAFKEILADAGFQVSVASSIDEAISFLEKDEYNVLIADRVINADDGMKLVKYCSEKHKKCVPILMSGFPSYDPVLDEIKSEIYTYIEKPIKTDELVKIIKNAALYSVSGKK